MPIRLPYLSRTHLVHMASIEPVGGAVTVQQQASNAAIMARERSIDEQLAQSFPASEPPSGGQGTAPLPH